MKVTDDTLQKLAFTIGIPYFFADCVFDRGTGTATIARRFFFIPVAKKQMNLADIDRVVLEQQPLTSKERADGEREQPYPVIIMCDASRLRLASSTAVGAKWAADAINTFLQAHS